MPACRAALGHNFCAGGPCLTGRRLQHRRLPQQSISPHTPSPNCSLAWAHSNSPRHLVGACLWGQVLLSLSHPHTCAYTPPCYCCTKSAVRSHPRQTTIVEKALVGTEPASSTPTTSALSSCQHCLGSETRYREQQIVSCPELPLLLMQYRQGTDLCPPVPPRQHHHQCKHIHSRQQQPPALP